jgi:hypothetical protein
MRRDHRRVSLENLFDEERCIEKIGRLPPSAESRTFFFI